MIFVECESDKVLLKALGIPSKEVKHAYGKGNICNKLERSRNFKGLVDEDPYSIQPSYMRNLQLHLNENDIKVLYNETNQNTLNLLCPNLEKWFLKAVKEENVDIKKYGLPDDVDKLHKAINTKVINFENLIKDIMGRSKEFKTLKKVIKEN